MGNLNMSQLQREPCNGAALFGPLLNEIYNSTRWDRIEELWMHSEFAERTLAVSLLLLLTQALSVPLPLTALLHQQQQQQEQGLLQQRHVNGPVAAAAGSLLPAVSSRAGADAGRRCRLGTAYQAAAERGRCCACW
jgi:hypothetical protein